jgi:hypothetical protein
LIAGHGDVRDERQISRLDLEALVVGLGLQRFDRAPIEAPDIEGVRHLHLRGVEIVTGWLFEPGSGQIAAEV